jgi:hypothetical protein
LVSLTVTATALPPELLETTTPPPELGLDDEELVDDFDDDEHPTSATSKIAIVVTTAPLRTCVMPTAPFGHVTAPWNRSPHERKSRRSHSPGPPSFGTTVGTIGPTAFRLFRPTMIADRVPEGGDENE